MPLTQVESAASAFQAPARLHTIAELNGIRGLAALIVFYSHALGYFAPDPRWGRVINAANSAARGFFPWVDVFFVLSGYLVTTILLRRRHSSDYYRTFYWRRILRIVPLYGVVLLAILVLFPNSGRYVLLATFFLANFNGLFNINFDGPFWTLGIEEQFYLLWPAVLHRRSVAQVRRLSLLIAGTVIVLRLLAALANHGNFTRTFFRLDGLAMGAWLACYFFDRKPAEAPRHREIFRFSLIFAVGATLATISGILAFFVLPTNYVPQAMEITGMVVAYTGFFGLLLVNPGRRGLQAILRTRFLRFFGLISYAFYMTHLYVIHLYDRWHAPLRTGDVQQYLLRFVVAFAITTALSLLSRYLIELPALSLRRFVLPPTIPPAETQLPLTEA